ncbi:unnamed protein product [Sphagnum jensenii]|uniref:Polycomb protein VEFS-Box domain-containing protein n=1 Tax=Sphagnum jensenii TaxID=128206 RepID=A0ABP1BR80_9BRYO
MAPEAVLSDRDSEDDVDEELAVLEDHRMLDDFVDVSNDEKDVMHLWNSFVWKQRYDGRFSHLKNQIEKIYDRGL